MSIKEIKEITERVSQIILKINDLFPPEKNVSGEHIQRKIDCGYLYGILSQLLSLKNKRQPSFEHAMMARKLFDKAKELETKIQRVK